MKQQKNITNRQCGSNPSLVRAGYLTSLGFFLFLHLYKGLKHASLMEKSGDGCEEWHLKVLHEL